MIAAALLAVQAPPIDCGRVRSEPDLQSCELERGEHDVLNSGERPPAIALGPDAIRFSTEPSLGGRGIIVELAPGDRGGARGRVLWFDGHPYSGWERQGSAVFSLSASEYRRLASTVDRSLAAYRERNTDRDYICTDGEDYVTERVRSGSVVTLTGSCPYTAKKLHPNGYIGAAMLSLACPYVLAGDPDDLRLRRNCRRWRWIARAEGAPVR